MTNGNFCLRRLEGVTPNLDEFRAAVTEIVNNGTRASAVISRIRALLMKGASNRTELDINEVIQEVAILLRNEATRNRVSLRTDLGDNLPRVSGDRVQLQQVVINLVMNGIEAMRLLAHRPRNLLIRSDWDRGEVLIRVQDSEPGSMRTMRNTSSNHSLPPSPGGSEWEVDQPVYYCGVPWRPFVG